METGFERKEVSLFGVFFVVVCNSGGEEITEMEREKVVKQKIEVRHSHDTEKPELFLSKLERAHGAQKNGGEGVKRKCHCKEPEEGRRRSKEGIAENEIRK